MWLLKSKQERNGPVSLCLPLGNFSIGRIECSFNITDDKSVSRKHANFEVKSASEVYLSDSGSKFGTWLNGQRIESAQLVKDGDSIKFGGLESEFTLVEFKVWAFAGEVRGLDDRNQLATLANQFSFSLSTALTDAAWNFIILPDTIATISSALLVALARSASIVRLEYFLQLSASVNFSEALMQPSCPAFPPKYLLPRPRRCEQISTALAGVRQLICLQVADFDLLSPLQSYLNLAVVLSTPEECVNVPFCDLLVAGAEARAPIKVTQLTRAITVESFVEAFVQCNETLLFIENVYPVQDVGDGTAEEKEPVESEIETTPITVNREKSLPSVPSSAAFSNSPIIVQIIPSSLLRPQRPLTATAPRTRFVKCHPLTRQPNSVPLLYGPHQLQSTAPTPSTTNNQANSNARKRILIKDAWLAEEEGIQVEFNKNSRTDASSVMASASTADKTRNTSDSSATSILSSAATHNHAPTLPSTATSTQSATAPKFQSSFFQNLQKKT